MRVQRTNWLLLVFILIAQLIVLWISPEERTLGVGIKPVYLHVSLTWTGMLLLAVSGFLGFGVAISTDEKMASWLKSIYTVGFGIFGAGFLVSLYASVVNWGGVPFREPRVITALNIFVVAAVVWVLTRWIPRKRLNGLLSIVPVVFMVMTVKSSTTVLHPDNPVQSSPNGIKYAFYGMFMLALLLAGWWVFTLRKKENAA